MELCYPLPTLPEIQGQFSSKWLNFVSRFRNRQKQSGQRRHSFLMHFGSRLVKELRDTNQLSTEDLTKFSSFVESLEHECLFQVMLGFLRYLFFNHQRKVGEVLASDFYTELKLLSEWCSFDNASVDKFIKNHMINSLLQDNIRDVFKNFTEFSSEDIVDICKKIEDHDGPVTPESVLLYIKDQQQKLSQTINVSNDNNVPEESFDDTAEELGYNVDNNSILIADHEYTNYLGSYSVVDNGEEYESYCFEILSPMEATPDSVPDILNGTSSAHVPEGRTATEQPSLSSHKNPPSSNVLSPPPPPSIRPCMSVTRSKPKVKKGPMSRRIVIKKVRTTPTFNAPTSDAIVPCPVACESNSDGAATSFVDPSSFSVGENIVISVFDPNSNSQVTNTARLGEKAPLAFPNDSVAAQEEISVAQNAPVAPIVAPIIEEDSFNKIPNWCCSHQRAVLKTSQILESTGQSVDLYNCNFCVYSCPGRAAMEEHAMQEHRSLKCYVCTLCNTKFPFKDQFESHFRIKHLNVEEHKCETCDMVFDSQDKLFVHMESHATLVSCRVCGAVHSTEKLLSDHMAAVHPDTPRWGCHICPSAFSTKKALSDHARKIHKDEKRGIDGDKIKRFICKPCGVNFVDKKSSMAHKRKFHWKPRAKQFSCDFCSYVTTTTDKLKVHRRTHTGEKPYICEICGKGFAQSSYLTSHLRVHTGEKPYKCRYCDRAFVCSASRLCHERKHRNERPYVCELCSKTFRSTCELKLHIETHNESRVKRFQCHCGAAFDTNRNLKRHSLCHSETKAHKCELCGARFMHLENIRSHQRKGACHKRMMKKAKKEQPSS